MSTTSDRGGSAATGEVTRRAAPPKRYQSLAKRAVCSIVHFSYCFRARCCADPGADRMRRRGRSLALTFSTLLSSQGAGAHRGGPSSRSRGNLRNITRSVPRRQTWVIPGSHRTAHPSIRRPERSRTWVSGRPPPALLRLAPAGVGCSPGYYATRRVRRRDGQGSPVDLRDDSETTSSPATERLPRLSTSHRPCSRLSRPGRHSASVTRTLFT